MKICDIHTHSANSADAVNTVEEMCISAVNKGLFALAVTDHCDIPELILGEKSEFGDLSALIPKSNRETLAAREKFSGKLKVLTGIELGEPTQDPKQTERALGFGNFDVIIASLHSLKNKPDFYYMDFNREDVTEILNHYFDELLEVAAFKDFCTLAHLTYPLRYIKRDLGIVPPLEQFRSKTDLIYETLIKNDKALEINASGLFKELGETLPGFEEIKRFRALGGRYVTIGSDAHCMEDVGRGIKEGIELAKAAGFDSYVIFENRCPVEIKIG